MKVEFLKDLIDLRDGEALLTQKVVKGQWKLDINGDHVTDDRGQWIPITETVPLTLKHAALESLSAIMDEDQRLDQEEKLKRGKLMEKICFSPDSSFTVEEVALIKQRIAKLYNPLVVIAAERLIEKKEETEDDGS